MKCKGYLLSLLSWCLAGCAAYQLEPLSANHPAYPDAAAAPERPCPKHLPTPERTYHRHSRFPLCRRSNLVSNPHRLNRRQ